MPEIPKQAESQQVVRLKDPEISAFLAWLIPGLGHLYQGRHAKAALYFLCIMGLFVCGVYLGGSSELGWGRVVYFSWQEGDKRLHYLCQIGIGLPALPALIQANRMHNNRPVLWNGFMAPPRPMNMPREAVNGDQPTAHRLHLELKRYFELGQVYTMIAGLLNILAIYDALSGPVTPAARKEEEKRTTSSAEADSKAPPPTEGDQQKAQQPDVKP